MERKAEISGNPAYYAARKDEEALKSIYAAFENTLDQLKALAEDMGVACVTVEYNNEFDFGRFTMRADNGNVWKNCTVVERWHDYSGFTVKNYENDLAEKDGNENDA